jgi:hypothetical protein
LGRKKAQKAQKNGGVSALFFAPFVLFAAIPPEFRNLPEKTPRPPRNIFGLRCIPETHRMSPRPMPSHRNTLLILLVAAASLPARADDVLFIGNSFTFGATAPPVQKNGGVPKLFAEIATAKGREVATSAVTGGGKDWAWHLAQPATEKALGSKPWTWVVLQDFSTRPTRLGNVEQFVHDGETFSERIAQTSPHAGIILYETWARPPGAFYLLSPAFGPEQMMRELHESYGRLREDLAAKNPAREERVAPVGTAFARDAAEYPAINLDASDRHHATAEGYYLAALVIYETIYHDSAKGAPTSFFHGDLVISADDAAKLQGIADEVAGGAVK